MKDDDVEMHLEIFEPSSTTDWIAPWSTTLHVWSLAKTLREPTTASVLLHHMLHNYVIIIIGINLIAVLCAKKSKSWSWTCYRQHAGVVSWWFRFILILGTCGQQCTEQSFLANKNNKRSPVTFKRRSAEGYGAIAPKRHKLFTCSFWDTQIRALYRNTSRYSAEASVGRSQPAS